MNAGSDLTLEWGGSELLLCPERAAFWPAQRVLFVADFHLGKAHSFRRLGIPVPGGTSEENLMRLGALVDRLRADEVVFLGDFLHAARARTGPGSAAFFSWRTALPALALTLIRGNHDQRAGDPPAAWRMRVVDEPHRRGPWALCHHPQRRPGSSVLAGHLHPAAVLVGAARDRLRLPAFHAADGVLVLPAFGAFTGLKVVSRQVDDLCFVTDGTQVVRVP